MLDGPKTVKFLPPGSLAYENELLPAHRRWMLQVTIESFISASEEVWIYRTPDYFQSWWTQGEIVHLLNMMGGRALRLRIFNPSDESLSDFPPSMLHPLDDSHKKPIIGKAAYFNDEVFSDRFNFWPLVQCDSCNDNHGDSIFHNRIDVDAFLQCDAPLLYPLDPRQLMEIIHSSSRTFRCPGGCGTLLELSKSAPRYLWYARRMGKPTGPEGKYITELPCFRARRVG